MLLVGFNERRRPPVGLWPPARVSTPSLKPPTRPAASEDPEREGRLRKAAKAIGGVSRDAMTAVVAAVISRWITRL